MTPSSGVCRNRGIHKAFTMKTGLGTSGRRSLRRLAAAAVLVWLGLLVLPGRAYSDGKIIPETALPAHIVIPDQQALIHFANGVEWLVIETRFTGDGTNFAWVVPLPSQPVIEEASAGLFPTLQYTLQPHIQHDVTPYYLWAVGFATFGLVFIWAWRQDHK